MRLDLFLKSCRVVSRRTIAKATCDAGRVFVNGTLARAGREVSLGDIVTIDLPHRVMKFRVLVVPVRPPRKSEADDLIGLLENRRKDADA